MEIKKREVLFSVILAFLLFCFGFFLSGKISEGVIHTAEKYATATIIQDAGEFVYGMSTNFGDALVYGEVSTDKPVTYDEIGNGFIYIEKIKEEYRRHTRTVTYTDSDGKTHTRTETYWTWDYIWSDSRHADTITFLGVEFPYDKIKMPDYRLNLTEAGISNRSNYVYTSSDERYYYNVTPEWLRGTVFAELRDGTMENTSRLYYDQTPDSVIKEKLTMEKTSVTFFWIAWVVLIGFAIYGFLYLENRWLN